MGLFFGTDGFRGKFGFEISPEVATRCGSALAEYSKNNKAKNNQQIKILIGTDTRLSCDVLALSFACGALSGGVHVT